MSVDRLLEHPTSKHIKALFIDGEHTWIDCPLKCTQGTNGDQRESGAIEQICQRWPQQLPQMEDGIVVWFWVLLVSERSSYLLTVNPHVSARAGPFSRSKWEKWPSPHIRWRKTAACGFFVTHLCLHLRCFWTGRYFSLLWFRQKVIYLAFRVLVFWDFFLIFLNVLIYLTVFPYSQQGCIKILKIQTPVIAPSTAYMHQ